MSDDDLIRRQEDERRLQQQRDEEERRLQQQRDEEERRLQEQQDEKKRLQQQRDEDERRLQQQREEDERRLQQQREEDERRLQQRGQDAHPDQHSHPSIGTQSANESDDRKTPNRNDADSHHDNAETKEWWNRVRRDNELEEKRREACRLELEKKREEEARILNEQSSFSKGLSNENNLSDYQRQQEERRKTEERENLARAALEKEARERKSHEERIEREKSRDEERRAVKPTYEEQNGYVKKGLRNFKNWAGNSLGAIGEYLFPRK